MQGSLATGRHGNSEGKLRAHAGKQKQEAESILGKTCVWVYPSVCSTSDQAQFFIPGLGYNVKFPGALFSSDYNFCISFCLACSFALLTGTEVINSHVAEPILDCLEISYTEEISPLLFNSALGKFLGLEQKAATFSATISQEWSLASHECCFFYNLRSLGFHMALSTSVFPSLMRTAHSILLTAFNHFFHPNSQSLPYF